MLDAHPELAIPAETHFVPELLERERECSRPRGAGRRRSSSSRTWGDFGLEADALREAVAESGARGAADVLRTFYGLCAAARGKPRWGDKTPGYVKRMRPIAAGLPEARFVHLIRDGRDVALSRRGPGHGRRTSRSRTWPSSGGAASNTPENRPSDCAAVTWSCATRTWSPTRSPPCALFATWSISGMTGRCSPFTKRPARGWPSSATWAADAAGRERDAGERRSAHALAAEPPSQARTEVWRTEMSAEDREAFEAEAGGLLADLGYHLPS